MNFSVDKFEVQAYFTPRRIVVDMLLLIKNQGEILEPSCDNARLFYYMAIEINAKCLEYHF